GRWGYPSRRSGVINLRGRRSYGTPLWLPGRAAGQATSHYMSSGDTLNTVVCRYLAEDGEIEDIYPALKRVMSPLDELSLPTALVKLAEIRPFKLFVSTTFDPLLAQALNRVRYGGQDKTQILSFSPNSTQD